ncbi:hypothetical protein [Streptomyces sp. HNM1019]|uniref:hypothetical protein n=1 Tax=Streptomyces sp. HNM1019 TaxID=3424717 RepID=UPI003D787DE3
MAAAGHRPYATQLTAGEPVRAGAELLDASGDVVGQVITGADGSFGFEALTGDHCTVVGSGHAPATRQITVGGAAGTERRDVDFLLGHGDGEE